MKSAVLTGDVVNSTKLSKEQQKKLEQLLGETLAEFNEELFSKSSNYMQYRGDSFQLVTTTIEQSLQIALRIRLAVKEQFPKNDVRIAIGIGKINTPIASEINKANGSAFINSGKSLDDMQHELLVFKSEEEQLNRSINMVLQLTEVLISKWTTEMCTAMNYLLQGLNQSEIGKRLNIQQPAVSKRINNANADSIMEVLKYYGEMTSKL